MIISTRKAQIEPPHQRYAHVLRDQRNRDFDVARADIPAEREANFAARVDIFDILPNPIIFAAERQAHLAGRQCEQHALRLQLCLVESVEVHEGVAVGVETRSEESRVGKECVSTCRSRGSPDHEKKKKTKTQK